MRASIPAVLVALIALTGIATPDDPKAKDLEDIFFPLPPQEVAAGLFETWQLKTVENQNPNYTRVEYDKKVFWVVQNQFGFGQPSRKIAVYAPMKDGSFQRCLLAHSKRAGNLVVAVDAKTGMLEWREKANSAIKGEVVLAINLKDIGTQYSTGLAQ